MSGLTIEASIEKAILLKVHGLNDDAKRELINLIFDENAKDKDKPRTYYCLRKSPSMRIEFNLHRTYAGYAFVA